MDKRGTGVHKEQRRQFLRSDDKSSGRFVILLPLYTRRYVSQQSGEYYV